MFWLLALMQSLSAEAPQISLQQAVSQVDTSRCSVKAPCQGNADGVDFSITAPTIASFKSGERWELWITVDSFTDEKSCVLRTNRSVMRAHIPEVLMTLHDDAPTFSVYHAGERHYPGSEELYRVDRNPVVTKREGAIMPNPRANLLLKQMRAGNSLQVAYTSWPNEYREGSTIDLTGFSAIYRAANNLCDRA